MLTAMKKLNANGGYSLLLRLSLLMLLDAGLLIALLLTGEHTEGVIWCVLTLRLVAEIGILVTLRTLERLNEASHRAWKGYLLRILIYVSDIAVGALLEWFLHKGEAVSDSMAAELRLAFAVLRLLADTVPAAVGNCLALRAAADLMVSYGMDRQARHDRRCGNWLLGAGIVLTGLFALTIGLAAVYYSTGRSLVNALEAGSGSQALTVGGSVAFLLLFPAGFGYLTLWLFAALRMWQTSRCAKELTQ